MKLVSTIQTKLNTERVRHHCRVESKKSGYSTSKAARPQCMQTKPGMLYRGWGLHGLRIEAGSPANRETVRERLPARNWS
jgi:hypothetical protein